MAIDLSTKFNTAARGCFQEVASIFQSIDADFAQWQDSKGRNAKEVVEGERKQFQVIVDEAKNVRTFLREIEELAEKVENDIKKKV